MMEITRRFTKKIQAKRYEPIEFECSLTESVGEVDGESLIVTLRKASEELSRFCVECVERDLERYQDGIAREKGREDKLEGEAIDRIAD